MRKPKAISKETAVVFGRVLKTYRAQKGMSQESLAERSELHRTYISLLERGKQQPALSTVIQLARALSIPASEMIDAVDAEIQ